MPSRFGKLENSGGHPLTRNEMVRWIHDRLRLSGDEEDSLVAALDAVLARHEQMWQESKQEAIEALSVGFAEQISRLRVELEARDATVASISRYFEQLVAELTDRSHRDPKTKLINFERFIDQLESFLALEQRGRWAAVGLVDITGFKWYNDAFGHAVGDRIIERVAQLLREQVRSDDVVTPSTTPGVAARPKRARAGAGPAQPAAGQAVSKELHARFGGDEFCFLIPDLTACREARAIAERFREAVERYDWTSEDERLVVQPVRVDVGVVCLEMGPVTGRRLVARSLAEALIQRADTLMYEAKGRRSSRVHLATARAEDGELVEIGDIAEPGS
jgi:GGDEF domain-containing protein